MVLFRGCESNVLWRKIAVWNRFFK